jgi:hypothetical protein
MTTHTSTSSTQSNGHPPPAGALHRWVLPIRMPKPVNPALVKHAQQRADYEQNRIADAITTFAGSMTLSISTSSGSHAGSGWASRSTRSVC